MFRDNVLGKKQIIKDQEDSINLGLNTTALNTTRARAMVQLSGVMVPKYVSIFPPQKMK